MHASASGTDDFDEALLERAVYILLLELDGPLAVRMLSAQRLESGTDRSAVFTRQQILFAEHARVCDRRAHVIFDETLVQAMIFARCELQDTFISGSRWGFESR